MESIQNLLQLFTKFSNSIWILSYYGTFEEWERVMKRLCRQTLDSWTNNIEMYLNIQHSKRKWLTIQKYFDKKSSTFLLNDELYSKFELVLKWSNIKDEYKFLIDFIESVPNPHMLMFKSISMLYVESKLYFDFYSLLQTKLNRDPSPFLK